MDWPVVLLLGLAVTAGSFVQSSIGFGMAIVASPFVVSFAPELMPVALLVTSFSLPVVQLAQGPRDVDTRVFTWAFVARLVTTPLGVLIVAYLSTRSISILVGVLILVTVAASASRFEVAPTPRNAVVAGAIGGVAGTAASIGGPFLAMVLAGRRPTQVRSTLSLFFLTGAVMSVGSLAVGHQFSWHAFTAGAVWIPFMLVGYVSALPLRKHLDTDRLRRWVLVFCVVAAVSVIGRALVA